MSEQTDPDEILFWHRYGPFFKAPLPSRTWPNAFCVRDERGVMQFVGDEAEMDAKLEEANNAYARWLMVRDTEAEFL